MSVKTIEEKQKEGIEYQYEEILDEQTKIVQKKAEFQNKSEKKTEKIEDDKSIFGKKIKERTETKDGIEYQVTTYQTDEGKITERWYKLPGQDKK